MKIILKLLLYIFMIASASFFFTLLFIVFTTKRDSEISSYDFWLNYYFPIFLTITILVITETKFLDNGDRSNN